MNFRLPLTRKGFPEHISFARFTTPKSTTSFGKMTTRPDPAMRTAPSSRPASAPTINQGGLLHPTASLIGTHNITIGRKAILQLRSRADSTYTPIRIGANAIIAERASIGFLSPTSSDDSATLSIGEGVVIESGAVVEAASVGDYTIIEARAKIGKGAVIGANCKICAGVEVRDGDIVAEGTIVWGNGWDQRRIERDGKGLRVGAGRRGMVEGLGEGLRAVWSVK